MTDFDQDAYRNSVEKIGPRIRQHATLNEVLRLLAQAEP
jgi:hypothetical protein